MRQLVGRALVFCFCFATLTGCGEERQQDPFRATSNSDGAPNKLTHVAVVERFIDVAPETGLIFNHYSAGSKRHYFPEIVSGGIAVLDFDNDGDLDVFVAQAELLDASMPSEELRHPEREFRAGDRLFENQLIPDGQLRFVDVTEAAGISTHGYSNGIATGDIDNDGNIDVYIARFGSNTLLRSRGNGTFEEVDDVAGADDLRWNTSASFFDYDADGDIDLFVAAYVAFNMNYEKVCQSPTGNADYCAPNAYGPLVDRLFENVGDGRFDDATQRAGLGGGLGPGLGAVFDDFDGDGRLDIYVANDGQPNFLWKNLGNGRFGEVGQTANAAFNQDGNAEASMGVVSGDFDNDGDPDLFMTHLMGETNTLYRNDGSGFFFDSTLQTHLTRNNLPFTGFGTAWVDYDNDGWLDLFIANGAVISGDQKPVRTDSSYAEPDQLFHNALGMRFEDVSRVSGSAIQTEFISRGVALGDIDNDGDVDLVVSSNNGPVRLLLNQVGQEQNWLRVALVGTKSNRLGIGANVGLLEGESGIVWRRMRTDGSYLSANEPIVHFGLGQSSEPKSLVVVWSDGHSEIWPSISPNQQVVLKEGTGQAWKR